MTKEQDKLVTANMGYVITLARQYKSEILSTDDLISEGAIGIMKAAEKYDVSKGKPFVTFAAPYIRRAIEAAINRLQNDIDVRSTDESIPVGSRNNFTLLNVLEDHDAPKADATVEQASLSEDLLRGRTRTTSARPSITQTKKRSKEGIIKKMREIVFLLVCLFTYLPLSAKVIKVLAVGNSFSQDAVEQYLYELAAAQGDSLIIGNAYIGGCSIDTHYNNLLNEKPAYIYRKVVGGAKAVRRKATLQSIIRDEQWDIITLQQASQLSGISSSYSNLAQLKRLIQSYTTNLHVQFMWHMTWAYSEDFKEERFAPYDYDQRKMYSAIVSTMQNVLPAVGGFTRIIPSGIAVQLARYRLGDVLNRDGFHLSYTLGRYTAACTWCEVLTGRIIDGNRYWPAKISAEEATICQEAAHEAVFMQQSGRYMVF